MRGDKMAKQRQSKYYVSELKESCTGMIRHRLTKYYLSEIEARQELSRLSAHYDNLTLRKLLPNYKRVNLSA